MGDCWRERERLSMLCERRVLAWLCAASGALAVGGFLAASLVATSAGAVGATIVVGRMRNLRLAERLLSCDQ